MNRTIAAIAVWATLGGSTTLYAQRELTNLPDPDPEVERKSFIVADGFEVNLFAADPLIAKPIQMNFDPQGRLWLASSEVYPQIAPGQVANDKVLVLEDVDGDGKADKTTVFADGLLIPTGVEPGDDGAYVANSTELVHLRDSDGDGKADVRRVVLSGFGTEDTHHILHTLRWGYDGHLYFNQSIYIHSHIETPHGVRRLNGGGIWRFRPETMGLEVFMRGLVNSWGHHFDRWGQSFATDGAGGEGINYVLPGAYYFTAPDAVRIIKGLNPGSPKHCGAEFASGRHLPDDWTGSILTNDFRGNRVCRFVLTEDGAGYASREQPEILKTKHVAFRPIDVKMGPDGAIYVADWYNPIIQHGEVDFRDARRDHTRGRIWRISAKGRPTVARPKLVGAPTVDLLKALEAPEDWTRQQARRVLKERGDTVVPELAAWIAAIDPARPDAEALRLEGLWLYQALDKVEPAILATVLGSTDGRARAAATRVAGDWSARLSDPIELLAKRAVDDHPRVRLEAIRALARIRDPRAIVAALKALDKPVDDEIEYAAWLTARDLQSVWLPELSAGRLDFGDPKPLLFALEAVGSSAAVAPLVASLREGKIPPGREDAVLGLLTTVGQGPDLALVFELALDDATPPARRAALIEALVRTHERRKVAPAGDLGRVGPLLDAQEDAVRAAAARAAGQWKVEPLRPRVAAIAGDPGSAPAVREASISALVRFGGQESLLKLDELAGPGRPISDRAAATVGLSVLDPKAGAVRAAALLAGGIEPEPAAAIVAAFAGRKDGQQTLAAALAGKTIPRDAAQVGVRTARASGQADPGLIEALTKAGGLTASPPAPTPADIQAYVAEVATQGDPARGEVVYRRAELNCQKCHAIAGAGGVVGPGLESLGASAQVDYLVSSILEPNKAIKENYHSIVVATADGQVRTGIKLRQSPTEVVIRDADGRELAIPADSIEGQKEGASLMPAGLADSLTRTEFVDLVRFLSELGKVGPYSVDKSRTIRRWDVLAATAEAATLVIRDRVDAAANPNPSASLSWTPAYSLVSGGLPLEALSAFKTAGSTTRVGIARGFVDVASPGPVRLDVGPTSGVTAWLDGVVVPLGPDARLELPAGRHAITLAVDLDKRAEPLRCTLADVPGSPAVVQPVLGP